MKVLVYVGLLYNCVLYLHVLFWFICLLCPCRTYEEKACRAGSDGSMSASGSAGPGFDPQRGSKFSFENFQPLD